MEIEQYAVMARREDRHWWYAGMRSSALALLGHGLKGQTVERLLDAGCGTGGTTVALQRFARQVVGVDFMWEAVRPAAARGLGGRLVRGSVERLPFADGAFDAVTSFEVIYHLGVGDDERSLGEIRRVLRPGGLLLLRLPAHDWLRGDHDRLVHTRHRYSKREVAEKLARAGFRVEVLSWANCALFAPAAAKRLLAERARPATAGGREGDAEPDLWQPPGPLNAGLQGVVGVEAVAFRRGWSLPFGLSVIALARARME